jgi:hypothetical protein
MQPLLEDKIGKIEISPIAEKKRRGEIGKKPYRHLALDSFGRTIISAHLLRVLPGGQLWCRA